MSRYMVMATWDDAPHLSLEEREALWASIPPYQREARSKGIPVLGAGQIYPVGESTIKVDDFAIPDNWRRMFGQDVGWNWTAGIWLAENPASKELFLYSCYKAGHAEPAVHAAAFRARGEWIQGAIDPAANSRGQQDGAQLLKTYTDLGLHLQKAPNAVEAGLLKVWQLLSTRQLKVFKTCFDWWDEFRSYHRDIKGNIVKENDHLMDATRYAVMKLDLLGSPAKPREPERVIYAHEGAGQGWMG